MSKALFDAVAMPHRNPGAAEGVAGMLFERTIPLPAGRLAARFHLAPPPAPRPGTVFCLAVLPETTDTPLAARQWPVDAALAAIADDLTIDFDLPEPGKVRLQAWISNDLRHAILRAVTVAERPAEGPMRWPVPPGPAFPLRSLRNVVIANSGVCTASCLHCPTGKDWLDVQKPRVMSEATFRMVIDGIAETGLAIRDWLSFGLFGDPLIDRNLAARIRYAREKLPGVGITANTNGAGYAPRHAEAIDLLDGIGVHIESLDPAIYDRVMAPLKLEKVKPRIEALVARAGKKALLVVPVHRLNHREAPALRK